MNEQQISRVTHTLATPRDKSWPQGKFCVCEKGKGEGRVR